MELGWLVSVLGEMGLGPDLVNNLAVADMSQLSLRSFYNLL